MYRILRHGSHIPGLPQESSLVFRHSGMKFRHTSDPLSGRVGLSQIWQITHIQWPISTSRHSSLTYDPTPGTPLNRVYPLHIPLEHFILLHSKHIFFLPECFESVAASTRRVSSFRHWTFRCRHGSSRSAPATIWIYAWSVSQGHSQNAITVMLCVSPFFEGWCPRHTYHRCTSLGDKSPHLTGFWLRSTFGSIQFQDPKMASVVRAP